MPSISSTGVPLDSSVNATVGINSEISSHYSHQFTPDLTAVDDAEDDLSAVAWAQGQPVTELAPLEALIPMALTGERLDKVLAQLFPQFSRGRFQSWLQQGRVWLDNTVIVNPSSKLKARGGCRIKVLPMADAAELPFTAENLPLTVLYRDAQVIVINKPAGLVVHPAAGNWSGTLLNGLLYHYPELAALPRAGIVHRLDKETSGVMVVARTLTAQTELVRQLQARTVQRDYRALVWGYLSQGGKIDAALARHPQDRLRMAVIQSGTKEFASAKAALTHYTPLAHGKLAGQPVTWVKCQLETGRTHQIRVHLQFLGFPLVGDPVYGRLLTAAARASSYAAGGLRQIPLHNFARQALHALYLQFLPPTPSRVGAEPVIARHCAPVPEDLLTLLEVAGIAHSEGQD